MLQDAGLGLADIDMVAYTQGLGWRAHCWWGRVAVSLATALGRPALPIHHLEGHLLALLSADPPEFPFVALLVSGGHPADARGRRG